MVENSIRTFALQDAAIVAEIGARFYVKKVPDNAEHPFVLLRSIDDDQLYTMTDFSGHIGLFQLDVFDISQSACEALAESLFSRFAGYSGVMGEVTVGYSFAEKKMGEWSPDDRHFRRVLEIRIASNDR